jgi:phosphate/sulfate permease
MDPSTLVLLTIVLVVAFDFSNGFHDASNMVATIVASRALTPALSIGMISLFSFLGPILGGTAVADTMGGLQNKSSDSSRKQPRSSSGSGSVEFHKP